MNQQNANIGIVTPEIQKEINDLSAELKSRQVDIDFFGSGVPFTGIRESSANHIFGNASWKKTCKDKLGEEMFETYAEKFGNKPIDLKLCGFMMDPMHSKYFLKGEKISVKSNSGKNTCQLPIVDKSDNTVTVMLPFTASDTGTIINLSKLEGVQKKKTFISGRLSQLTGPTTPPENSILSAPNTTNPPETQPAPTPDPPPRTSNPTSPTNLTNKPDYMKIIGYTLLVAVLAYGGYKAYQYFNKPK